MILHKELLQDIETKFGKKVSYQRDCKTLSDSVFEVTHEYISPATLRRLFGFLVTNSKPSRVTLDILSHYIGFTDWHHYVEHKKKSKEGSTLTKLPNLWEMLQEKAYNLNHQALKTIRGKSGIPFDCTIRRFGIEDQLNQFIASKSSAFALIGPGGYGKTTLIAHWYQNYLKENHNKILSFILSASKLEKLTQSDLSIGEWLWEQVEIDINSNPNIYNDLSKHTGSILFIIDALDEIGLTGLKLEKILKNIDELVTEFSMYSNLKLILTSRGATWKLFSGYITNPRLWSNIEPSDFNSNGANIPPFSYEEMQQVLDNTINAKNHERILIFDLPPQTRQTLSYPFYLQLFVNGFNQGNIQQQDPQSIISEFLKKKVYQTTGSDEKTDILNAIVDHWWQNQKPIAKKELKNTYPIHLKTEGSYYDAYHDLLSFGIISEDKIFSSQIGYESRISICNPLISTTILSFNLIKKYGFSEQLIKSTVNNYSKNENFIKLIASIYSIACSEKNIPFLKHFPKYIDKFDEISELALIIHVNFKRDLSILQELGPLFFAHPKISHALIVENPDFNSLTNSFQKLLEYSYSQPHLSEIAKFIIDYGNLLSLKLSSIQLSHIEGYNQETVKKHGPFVTGLWYALNLTLCKKQQRNKLVQDVFDLFSNFDDKGKAEFREALAPIAIITNNKFNLLNLFDTKLNVTAHQKSFDFIVSKFNNILKGNLILSAREHSQIMQCYGQLNPLRSNFGIVIGELSRSISFFYENKLEMSHRCIRNAIELCGYSGYRLPEMKLMRMLGNTLIKFNERKQGEKFLNYAQSLTEKSGIYRITDLFESDT